MNSTGDRNMGIETLIGLAIAGAVGGGISKAQGGSFWRGAALGAATGGVGSVLDAATGGHVSGAAAANKKKQDAALAQATQAGADAANASRGASALTRDQLLAGNPNVLSSQNTAAANTGRGRLLGN